MTRLYNVIVINEKTGRKVRMNAAPVTHSEGCTWLSKISDLKWRRKQLEEIAPVDVPTDADVRYINETAAALTYR